jgi:rhodanese-related sulfurtransferase
VNFKCRMFLTFVLAGLIAPLAIQGRQQIAEKSTATTAASTTEKTPATAAPAAASADVERITVDELKNKLASRESVVIIDVRGGDYDSSRSKIKGAIRIAPAEIESHLADLSRDSQIVTYCSCPTDGGAVSAARVLELNGFKNVRALKGGWKSWLQAGGTTERK